MNIASILVVCIVAGLMILAVVCSRKNKEGECGGNCAECKLCKKNIAYVNVMNNLSIDCDCDGYPEKPKMKDIGILASTDPVALDQAGLCGFGIQTERRRWGISGKKN